MFRKPLMQYSENLEALRDFVNEISPVLHNKIKEKETEQRKIIDPVLLYIQQNLEMKNENCEKKELSADCSHLDGKIIIEEEFKKEEKQVSLSIKMRGDIGHEFECALKKIDRRNHQTQLLYRSSLITLISSAEWFLAQLLHEYYNNHPDAIGLKDKVFSFNDLKNIGTIEDAKNYYVEEKIEQILRGSFEDWITHLKDKIKLSMSYIEPYKDKMTEAIQRRHLFIHNGGIVNSIYISKVPSELRNEVKIGESIKIKYEYLEELICLFEIVFILIGSELWKQLAPSDNMRTQTLTDISWKHLMDERWIISEKLNYFIMMDKNQPEIDRILSTFNYWQSLKWQNLLDDKIKTEIERFDTSAKQLKFSLAKAVLLDETEKIYKLIPVALKNNEITIDDLLTWPIFRNLRNEEQFKQFTDELKN